MPDSSNDQLTESGPAAAVIPATKQYRQYIHPLRSLFQSLHHDLSLGTYPTVPPPLRSLCHTARQHVHYIFQNTENVITAVAYAHQLLYLVRTEDLDGQLLAWHDLRSQQKFQAYLEKMGDREMEALRLSVEDRVCVILGLLLEEPEERVKWVEALNEWERLEERHGSAGKEFYEHAKGIL